MNEPSKLSSFFEDNSGGFSMTRLALAVWVVHCLTMFTIGTIKNDWKPVNMPDSTMIGLGILASSKAVQRFGEQPPTS